LHGLAFSLLPSDGAVKTKNPPPVGSGFWLNRCYESKTRRRAGKQRVRKQQVQIRFHRATLVHFLCLVIGKFVE
jgi:hypothetical protein